MSGGGKKSAKTQHEQNTFSSPGGADAFKVAKVKWANL